LDVGIGEGGIGNDEQLEIARHLRQQCRVLVAWGDCAVFGGINTLRNGMSREEIMRRGYIETESTVHGLIPEHEELPRLLEKVQPLNEVTHVDAYVPGCPPSPESIAYSLTAILQGRLPVLPKEMIHFD